MQKTYDIQNISVAWSVAIGNFAGVVAVAFIIGVFVIKGLFGFTFIVSLIVLAGIQSYYIFLANKRYYIDMESATITVPKSGDEVSLSEKFKLVSYWNYMKTRTIAIADIDDVIVDTKRWTTQRKNDESGVIKTEKHVQYNLKIIGTFGASSFSFKSGEKRDEISHAICRAIKELTGKELSCKDDWKTETLGQSIDSMMNNF